MAARPFARLFTHARVGQVLVQVENHEEGPCLKFTFDGSTVNPELGMVSTGIIFTERESDDPEDDGLGPAYEALETTSDVHVAKIVETVINDVIGEFTTSTTKH